jgi:hypothetical protein
MAGTIGWTLPEVEFGPLDQRKTVQKDLTVLLPIRSTAEVTTVPSDRPALASATARQAQTGNSLGAIKVQQDFNLAYERSLRDSMSLVSGGRS